MYKKLKFRIKIGGGIMKKILLIILIVVTVVFIVYKGYFQEKSSYKYSKKMTYKIPAKPKKSKSVKKPKKQVKKKKRKNKEEKAIENEMKAVQEMWQKSSEISINKENKNIQEEILKDEESIKKLEEKYFWLVEGKEKQKIRDVLIEYYKSYFSDEALDFMGTKGSSEEYFYYKVKFFKNSIKK